MRNICTYFITVIQFVWVGTLIAQTSLKERQAPGEIIYQLEDQTFLAKYTLTCEATKGIYNQVFLAADTILVEYPEQTGNEQIRFRFSQLLFAEEVHQENLTAEVSILTYSDIALSSSFSTMRWVSALREDGTRNFQVDFSPENSSSSSLSFLIKVLDSQGEVIGSRAIDINLSFTRPAPSPGETSVKEEEKKTMSEDDIWNIIQAENSVEGFEKYLILFPSGKYEDLAREKIIFQKEKNTWVYLSGIHTCRSYKDYLAYYPRGKYRGEAENVLKELGCSLEQPGNENITADRPPLDGLETEKTAYQAAVRKGTSEAFKDFLSQYPNGEYSKQVTRQIPFEILQQDFHHDSMFTVVFAYVVPPLTISRIEIEPDQLRYTEANGGENVPQAIQAGNSFFWPEGKFKAEIGPIRGSIYRFESTLISGKKYWVSFKDGTQQVRTLELDSQVPSMEILRVEGLDATQDTLWVEMKGGIPPYSVRFVKRGDPFSSYVHESQLIGDSRRLYLLKNELLKNMYLSGGIYDFFLLDKRKSQYKKNNLPILFSLDAGVNPHLWMYLAPVILLLIVILIIFYRRSTTNS